MKVVIIGAGVAGLAIGWRLRQAGVDVLILERAQAGLGRDLGGRRHDRGGARKWPMRKPPEAELAHLARRMWPDFAREIEEASGIDIGYRQSGALMIALRTDEAALYAARRNADPELKVLTPEDARAMEPMLGPVEGRPVGSARGAGGQPCARPRACRRIRSSRRRAVDQRSGRADRGP